MRDDPWPGAALLIDTCQRHLVQAVLARIAATEQAVGGRFAFETMRRGATTAVFAQGWPPTAGGLPFHRVFDYRAPSTAEGDPWLDRLTADRIDAVVEVLPGDHLPAAEARLRSYSFGPVWRIPWFHLDLRESGAWDTPPTNPVQRVEPAELAAFAEVLCDGYGYQGEERDAWRDLARYGYTAAGFVCFLATAASKPVAAGVLNLDGTSALVDGAATLQDHRGQGLQKALLRARLSHAKRMGAQHAFSRTAAGSVSEANLQKVGMRRLVESTAWRRS